MAHVDSHQSCCFRTEATGAKRNTLISVSRASLTSSIEKSPSGPTSTVMSSVPSWAAPAESSAGHDLEISAKSLSFLSPHNNGR